MEISSKLPAVRSNPIHWRSIWRQIWRWTKTSQAQIELSAVESHQSQVVRSKHWISVSKRFSEKHLCFVQNLVESRLWVSKWTDASNRRKFLIQVRWSHMLVTGFDSSNCWRRRHCCYSRFLYRIVTSLCEIRNAEYRPSSWKRPTRRKSNLVNVVWNICCLKAFRNGAGIQWVEHAPPKLAGFDSRFGHAEYMKHSTCELSSRNDRIVLFTVRSCF